MLKKAGSPAEERVSALQAKLNIVRADTVRLTDGQLRHTALQIAHVEQACKAVIEAIEQLDRIDTDTINRIDPKWFIFELKTELQMLKTILTDQEYIGSSLFINRMGQFGSD